MYTLTFYFSKGEPKSYPHIEKVQYTVFGPEVTLVGDELFGHKYPLHTIYEIYLFAKNETHTIRNINTIEDIKTSKEED
jgi:hypothetical protein